MTMTQITISTTIRMTKLVPQLLKTVVSTVVTSVRKVYCGELHAILLEYAQPAPRTSVKS